jgi:hypothetical protein
MDMYIGYSKSVLVAALLLVMAPTVGSALDDEDAGGGGSWSPPGDGALASPLGEYVLVGGGISDFTDHTTRDRFDVGGTWDLRLGLGSRFYVGGELAYVGSQRSGAGSGPDLTANGAEGVIRVQYPYVAGQWLVEPFAFGGIGWSHLSLSGTSAAGLATSDDVGVVPFGGGFTIGHGHLLLDARFTYRVSFNEDLRLAANEGPAKLSQWSAGASIGYEF